MITATIVFIWLLLGYAAGMFAVREEQRYMRNKFGTEIGPSYLTFVPVSILLPPISLFATVLTYTIPANKEKKQ